METKQEAAFIDSSENIFSRGGTEIVQNMMTDIYNFIRIELRSMLEEDGLSKSGIEYINNEVYSRTCDAIELLKHYENWILVSTSELKAKLNK